MGSYDVSGGGKRGPVSHQSRETPGRQGQSERGRRLMDTPADQWRWASSADHVGRRPQVVRGRVAARSLPPSLPAWRGRAAPGRAGPAALPGYRVVERSLSQWRRGGGGRRDGCGPAVAGRAQFGRRRLRSMVAAAALPAAGLLYWVGALSVLSAAALASYRLLAGLRVWVLGSGAAAVGPALGAWAGECASRPAALPPMRVLHPRGVRGCGGGTGCPPHGGERGSRGRHPAARLAAAVSPSGPAG